MKNRVLIGIDPDVEKSGVAMIDQNKEVLLSNRIFFDLFRLLRTLKAHGTVITAYIEAGWLNKSNWHAKKGKSAALNAKIGERTGANFEVGKKIVEMMEYLDIDYKLVRPTQTKLKADTFKKITGIKQRTNQEQRDAYMLIHGR